MAGRFVHGVAACILAAACTPSSPAPASSAAPPVAPPATSATSAPSAAAAAPASGTTLRLVADVELPGGSTRFDYQEIDTVRGRLVVAHMNDASVLVLDLRDGSVVRSLPGIPTPRGVAIGDGRIFVTSSPAQLVIVDAASLKELGRVPTGNGPDGVAFDPVNRIVAVSDQRDGAISLIADSGSGARTKIAIGKETGNVVFDGVHHAFWAAVVNASPPDQIVRIDQTARAVVMRIDLPGCSGAHGLRIHPDGKSALVACEDDDVVVRVDLSTNRILATGKTGKGADVLSIDPGLGWLYVAAESGDLTVFDIGKPGLDVVAHEHPGDHAHSVVVDAPTHRVFFPLMSGPSGRPVMRIMQPAHDPRAQSPSR